MWTKGKLVVRNGTTLFCDQQHIASCVNVLSSDKERCISAKDNANRFVMCWNGWDALVAQRDKLLEVCKKVRDSLKEEGDVAGDDMFMEEDRQLLEAAIAACKES